MTVEDQAGLSQGSADGFQSSKGSQYGLRCRRVWLSAGAGVPLRTGSDTG